MTESQHVPSITTPPFSGFAVRKKDDSLSFVDGRNYESRNEHTKRIISDVVGIHRVPDFDWVLVNTDDMDLYKTFFGYKVLCFSTADDDYSQAVPDYTFSGGPEVGINDYGEACNVMEASGNGIHETDALGWRGALTHINRRLLVQFHDGIDFDTLYIDWDYAKGVPDNRVCPNFVSLTDHPRRWRFLMDVEAYGWSGRLKFLFFSNRVVFLHDRPYREWYFPLLKPWVHYVPVKRDMSDLRDNLARVKGDRGLEESIRSNAMDFAKKNLTRGKAYERWAEVLTGLAK